MRISTAYQYSARSTAIESNYQLEFKLQQEISSGKKLNQPSDSPYGTYASLSMTAVNKALTQYDSNLSYAKATLSTSDNALSQANTIATSAYQLALQGANSTTSQAGRTAMVSQITQLESQLVAQANTTGSDGQYLFGGQKTQAAPYTVTTVGGTSTLSYSGDTNNLTVEVGPGQTMAVNTQASSTFTTLYSQLESLKANLNSGNTSAISNIDVANLQQSSSAILQSRGDIGAKLQSVASMTSQNAQRATDLTTQITGYTDADIAQVATQYQSAATAYQAALQISASSANLSLLNYVQGIN